MEPQVKQDVTLSQVIAWTESKGNRTAVRFEPSIWEKLSERQTHSQSVILALIGVANHCSHATARMIYASSWGCYQIMGFNLYGPELSINLSIGDYLNSQAAQDDAFVRLTQDMALSDTPASLAASGSTRAHFGRVWNGSALYAEPLSESLAHYGLTIKD